jgi:hypothetical protein
MAQSCSLPGSVYSADLPQAGLCLAPESFKVSSIWLQAGPSHRLVLSGVRLDFTCLGLVSTWPGIYLQLRDGIFFIKPVFTWPLNDLYLDLWVGLYLALG